MENLTSTDNKNITMFTQKLKILQMMADDVPRKQITDHFKLSSRTIEYRLDTMKKSFECESVPALIAKLFRRGLLK